MVQRPIGDYDLIALIGSGGMGAVHRARHRTLGVDRALELVHVEGAPERQRRFEREAQHLARLDHPNVVRVPDGARLVTSGDGDPALWRTD